MTQEQKPTLNPANIDSQAYQIVKNLQRGGYTTYLVGGCVRDLLLGIRPKDYDIATDARPNEVRRIISQAYVIGKRFRLVLVKRGDQQFEVATFRRNIMESDIVEDLPPGDNIFGTPQEDAQRRDFTINGLLYDPIKDELIDYAAGRKDLDAGLIRMIGDPDERLEEDPIRILRAVRLAHKIRFSIETELRKSIYRQAHRLTDAALPRKREEFLKFLRVAEPSLPLLDCFDLNLFKYTSPTLDKILATSESHDEFLRYMRNYHDHRLDFESPVELFAGLVLAVIRSSIAMNPHQPIRAKEILENQQLKVFMKDELGMFNYEQDLVAKALQLQTLLLKPEEFERRSLARQSPVLKADAFRLALKLALRDYSLSSDQLHYWQAKQSQWSKLAIESPVESPQPKRKRRRRRKNKTNPGK